ncbi:MAG: DUF488 family protein [Deltaproteobacteria bacterium]|nr:DUF488 family protein [Deltaproteobacteria bacterium]MBW2191990.1 DUF488 family protein [Deltaproteobacteria bacterium]MBW2223646.1 DUF488 family protein [Deltaproteobacteria bacterium]MBW2404177.1 DUF488 family protein [Deltaproteobacteria bacterium]MBW2548167.1 DUF488 family protein [Deltaproteobacteria bacterium]
MNVRVKRVYEPAEPGDGLRVLVDRLWPRGLSKEVAKVDLWVKELAPSTELRRWFHSEAGSWGEFQKRYSRELSANWEVASDLRRRLGRKKTTFVFAVKDSEHNHAILLKAFLEKL